MTEPQQEPTRLQDLCRLRGTPAGLGGSRDKPSTHLEEIRRHLLLHQMALDVLDGALRERLGKEGKASDFSMGPALLSPRPGPHPGPRHTHVSRPAAPS